MLTKSGVKVIALGTLVTVMTLLAFELPAELTAVSVTVYDPAAVKVWLGFWMELVPPSPKFHDQDVGLPVDLSVNVMVCAVTGASGVKMKAALGMVPAWLTITF